MYCRHCGAQNHDTSRFCSNCGKAFAQPQPMQPSAPISTPPSAMDEPDEHYEIHTPGIALAIVGFILSMISVCSLAAPYGLGFVVGLIGIILCSASKVRGNTGGLPTAGIVCSALGMLFSLNYLDACTYCA